MKYLFVFLLFLLTSLSTAAYAQTKGDVVAGKAKFDSFCVACHGPGAKGDGVAAAGLNPKPRDLTITKRTDAEMAVVIKGGGPAGGLTAGMPAWGAALSDQDIANVIAYVRQLSK